MRKHWTDDMAFGIIGLGRVGSVFALRLENAGFPLKAVWDIDPLALERAVRRLRHRPETTLDGFSNCSMLIISVPDRTIDSAAHEILAKNCLAENTVLAHTSGLHRWDPALFHNNPHVLPGSIHPLMAFPKKPEFARNFEGIGFCLTGEPQAITRLEAIVELFKGYPLQLPDNKRDLYHIAAVFASNFPVLMHGIACDILAQTGLDKKCIRSVLTALLDSVGTNLSWHEPADALSGPAVRKDWSTINTHLDVLKEWFPEHEALYSHLTNAVQDWLSTRSSD
jgi:predicted short-subunit dehydrogenase-like oxidoreductase (DUF2520 family)